LVDYYKQIKEPISLNGIYKKVRGISGAKGRETITGQSEFRSWDALENEAKKVWLNAQEYNEDGSDIYIVAGELKVGHA